MTDQRAEHKQREVFIARHGQAHANVARTIAGPACTGLTAEGQTQAAALGEWMAEQGGVTALHASTTPRARETAEIVGRNDDAVKKLQARGLASLRRGIECLSGCWRVDLEHAA